VRCVAAPVLNAPAPVAISVSGPTERVTTERVPQIAVLLQEIASQLSIALRDEVNEPSPI